jgi:hypothetical protein
MIYLVESPMFQQFLKKQERPPPSPEDMVLAGIERFWKVDAHGSRMLDAIEDLSGGDYRDHQMARRAKAIAGKKQEFPIGKHALVYDRIFNKQMKKQMVNQRQMQQRKQMQDQAAALERARRQGLAESWDVIRLWRFVCRVSRRDKFAKMQLSIRCWKFLWNMMNHRRRSAVKVIKRRWRESVWCGRKVEIVQIHPGSMTFTLEAIDIDDVYCLANWLNPKSVQSAPIFTPGCFLPAFLPTGLPTIKEESEEDVSGCTPS